MIDPPKKLPARFYETASGNKPVREWLLEQNQDDRRTVGHDIQTAEFGWPLGMPTCRPLGNGWWEVRSNMSDDRVGRVIFCISHGAMVLLHGFVKKTQKTPKAEIELAHRRRREIE